MSDTPRNDSRNAVTRTATSLDDRTRDPAAPSPEVAAPAPGAPIRSRELGPVRLVCEIGRGGMGVVWRGRHRVLGRDVAVKFLQHAVAGAEDPAFERLVAEARAAATVRHPNLVPVYHADVADGCPYLVMEYVHGLTLARLAAAGPLAAGVALAILADAAAAVEALHDRGMIHRDLKPGNVLLDAQGHVYVADFGLALEHKRGMAQSGAAPAGTPLYMAPETFDGHFSPKSDVYALGLIAFELLTGRPPFMAGSAADLRRLHSSEPLPADRLRTAGVPDALVEMIGRATNKAPVFRYKSARELGRSLATLAAAGVAQERTELRRIVIRVGASLAASRADGDATPPAAGDAPDVVGNTTTNPAAGGPVPAGPWDTMLSRVAGRFRASRQAAAAAAPARPSNELVPPPLPDPPPPGPGSGQ